MPVPNFQALMLPVLLAVESGQASTVEIRQRVALAVELTEAELEERLPSGRSTTFLNRVAWALTYLQTAGLLEKVNRGVYQISDVGKRVLSSQPQSIDMKFLDRFPEYVTWRRGSNQGEQRISAGAQATAITEETTPEEQIEISYQELTRVLESELLQRLYQITPNMFETLVVDLLIAMGYGGGRAEMGQAIGHSGDGGIDGIIKEDPLGIDIVYIQAKRYADKNTVGRPAIQGFAGSLDGVGATKGIFFTTSTFSSGAKEFAKRVTKRIILIDGPALARLMVEHDVGVRMRTRYEIRGIDESYFDE